LARRTDIQASVATATRHPGQLTIEPFAGTVTVRFSDAIVAATERAKVLREEGHEPVFYIPFEDIYFDLFEKTDTTSESPMKGTASYWRVHAVGSSADDFMWAYETPDTAARAIAGHGAFDPEKARIDVEPSEDKRHTPHVLE
jgi:uncharacterized protein (DUF427 family)